MTQSKILKSTLVLSLLLSGAAWAEDPFLEAMDGDREGVQRGLFDLQQDLTPGQEGLIVSQAEAVQGRIFTKEGRRYIRLQASDTLASAAREAYGDENLWYLIYFHNMHYLAANEKGEAGEVVLYLPPSPKDRARVVNGQHLVMAIPGDSFRGLASQLYGNPNLDAYLAQANLDRIPDRNAPNFIFAQPPQKLSRILVVPPASQAPTTQAGSVPGPFAQSGSSGPIDWSQVPGGVATTAPSTAGGTLPAASTASPASGQDPRPSASDASQNPVRGSIRDLQLSGPGQVGEREAAIVLEAAGFFHSRIQRRHMPPARTPLEAAMRAAYWGNTYRRPRANTDVTLDSRMKGWIFEQYTQLRESLAKYQGWSNISQRHRPQEYDQWIDASANQLTEVPSNKQVALMRSLMETETAKTHWEGYQPVISHAGAVGFGQFMPATARDLGINPYDPAQNIAGIAKYVNKLVQDAKRDGHSNPLCEGLARYNGGNNPPRSSYVSYADPILRRAGLPGCS